MVQMRKGYQCTTVGIDASRNACILACEILSGETRRDQKKLGEMKERMRREIDDKSRRLRSEGP